MRRAALLAWRLHRFELRILLVAAALLVVASLVIAWQTRVVRADELACYAAAPPPVEGSTGSTCPQFNDATALLESGRRLASGATTVSPFVLGLFLGVPLVAREIESGTAPIAWTLARSRARWLVQRAAPVLVGTLLVASAIAGTGELLTAVAPWNEGVDPGFQDFGGRGPLLVVRGVAVLGIGLAAGALIGRQLPALLVAGLVVLALMIGLTIYTDQLMRREAEPIEMRAMQGAALSKVYGSGFRDDATGEIIGFDEYYARPDAVNVEEPPGMTPVLFAVPGERYRDFVLRESAIFGAVTVVMGSGAWLIVRRRSP